MSTKNNDEWLKAQCNRHTNGMCQTRACLIRGGYSGTGPVNYAKATCEAHEILAELDALRLAAQTKFDESWPIGWKPTDPKL